MTKNEAEVAYRQAWTGWCLAMTLKTKRKLEQRMDFIQDFITSGPGPEWQAFVETLPGFIEFWESYDVEDEVEPHSEVHPH